METKAVMHDRWVALAREKPLYADRPVILFSPRPYKPSFEGDLMPEHNITVSNPQYARLAATTGGWTHWTDVPWPYPKTKRKPTKRR